MRPGDFSPGNPRADPLLVDHLPRASMRPGDFSPGNHAEQRVADVDREDPASMRPGDFSPGNWSRQLIASAASAALQ